MHHHKHRNETEKRWHHSIEARGTRSDTWQTKCELEWWAVRCLHGASHHITRIQLVKNNRAKRSTGSRDHTKSLIVAGHQGDCIAGIRFEAMAVRVRSALAPAHRTPRRNHAASVLANQQKMLKKQKGYDQSTTCVAAWGCRRLASPERSFQSCCGAPQLAQVRAHPVAWGRSSHGGARCSKAAEEKFQSKFLDKIASHTLPRSDLTASLTLCLSAASVMPSHTKSCDKK